MNETNGFEISNANENKNHRTFDELFEKVLLTLKKPTFERTPEQIDQIIEATKEFEFFQKMNAKKVMRDTDAHKKCCKRLKLENYPSGTLIFREGEPPEKFYIVLRGSVNVLIQKDPQNLQEEIAAMKVKYATIYKKAIDAASMKEGGRILITEYTKIDQRKIVNFLDKEISYPMVTGGVEVKDIENIEDLFQDGVFKFTCVATIEKGNIFGELGLIRKKPRAATIMVKKEADFGTMTKADYEAILLQMEKQKLHDKLTFFENFLPTQLSADAVTKFSYLFEKKVYSMNHDIFQPKDPIEAIFFIKSGEVLLYEHGEPEKNQHANKEKNEKEKIAMFHAVKLSKAEVVKLPLQQLGEGQYFGDEELFEGKRQRIYGAVCVSAVAKIYLAPKEVFSLRINYLLSIQKFLQLIEQQPQLLKFFQEKAKSKMIWHDKHKRFLEDTKFEANQRIYQDPNEALKQTGRITARALEKNFERYTKKQIGLTPERRHSAHEITNFENEKRQLKSILENLEGTKPAGVIDNHTHQVIIDSLIHKKRKHETIRRQVSEASEPGMEDSIIRYNRNLKIAEKHAEKLASRTRSIGVTSFISFQMGEEKRKTLSAAEVLEKKMRVQELDPNRHYYEVWREGSELYEKVHKSTVKQLKKASRSSSRATLTEFRIEKAELQSRDGPSILEKARRTYSMMSFTGISWRRGGATSRQHDSSTQTPALGLYSARTGIDSVRKERQEDEKEVTEDVKGSHQFIRTRNQTLAQVLADENSLFEDDGDDNNPYITNINTKFDKFYPDDNKSSHPISELPRTKSTAGRFQSTAYSVPVSSRADSGPTTPHIQFNRKMEMVSYSSKQMMLAKADPAEEKGFMELTNSKHVRKGNYQPNQPIHPMYRKTREYFLTWGKGASSQKKSSKDPNSIKMYVEESTRAGDQSTKKESSKEFDIMEKKLRKTKHNMFRFHYKPFI